MKEKGCYLGIDVGSVSTNLVVIDEDGYVIEKLYLKTGGQPIKAMRTGINMLNDSLGDSVNIMGVGATGSGRHLARVVVGCDIVKNEITSHAIAALKLVPDVKTILEIGGQDSKIILVRNGVVYDFAMNTVCAAGTGSFLDRQAARLDIPIEEFGKHALNSSSPVRIAGRCAVFAESDMIHKQQAGHSVEDIISGLCEALVRNYINNLAKGKELLEPFVFQGGVAANQGIVAAFEKELKTKIIIPQYYDVMGAFGAALMAREKMHQKEYETSFGGFDISKRDFTVTSMECNDCSNMCELIKISSNDTVLASWGDRCGKWSAQYKESEQLSLVVT
ncbi:acyl-CoA dehydratase activase [Pseudobacteroides cellulosolvens]|uniref:CoA-substrate-specific enzyme activase n=1 Tax=Pseudobacteroides cellulosolvens ATCC 35603 = DSM 2933 TaxID=398512 RepID=A0A0L6JRM8_9FIRM|nr:acyl-CoA dehydratase activase [Pseudobacteroides cellulosolvens]KNY28438.1 CoA-substrate-specific enzyme activase [Pseudobacteroides cellulosolvens ATCC 35603 = DSM 2933]